MLRRRLMSMALAAAVGTFMSQPASAQDSYTLTYSDFLPAVHQQHSVTTAEWAAELEERSNGRLKLQLFPAGQIGSVADQYDIARRGDADIAFILHGLPAGRFPLIELTHLPFIFESAEQATMTLNDLLPEYLEAEHRGVKVLYLLAHAPGLVHTTNTPVRTPEDMEGLRIRHPSAVVAEMVSALGATPQGLPPAQIAESLEAGVIDGLLMPYDGVYGFRLANQIKYSTELMGYINTFAVAMNPDSYADLPEDLQQLITETTGEVIARRAGQRWDAVEVEGKAYMIENGVEIIELTEDERAAFIERTAEVAEAKLAEAEAAGLPARAFMDAVRERAVFYAE
jgi:TRAP-type C4-dicarboxylate transport system substrate-binding protein